MSPTSNVTKVEYYEYLGVSRDCNDQELKTAYRRLAMQFHPDRNPGNPEAEEKFKLASEAYQVLSDPQKRAAYDRYGHAGVSGTGASGFEGFAGADVGDILATFSARCSTWAEAAAMGADNAAATSATIFLWNSKRRFLASRWRSSSAVLKSVPTAGAAERLPAAARKRANSVPAVDRFVTNRVSFPSPAPVPFATAPDR